ncbi:MAG: ParA family protein [Flammeovirgaceae bacterium]|nr:ParA family protein [Flammeovirgaceae bacterium]
MAEIISILNLKGGVGKTTTTINMGKALSLMGNKVLIIDNDPQANMTRGIGITKPSKSIYNVYGENETVPVLEIGDGFFATPSDLQLALIENQLNSAMNRNYKLYKGLKNIKQEFDYILIDCPPSLGVYTANALMTSDWYLFPIQAGDEYSIQGLKSMESIIAEIKEDEKMNPTLSCLGLLITMYEKTNANQFVIDALKSSYENQIFNSNIRRNTTVKESIIARMDIFSYDKNCHGAVDHMELAKEVVKRIKA